MRKIIHICLSIFILLTVWIPPTRLFMTGIAWGTILVFIVAMLLCYSSLDAYSKEHSKFNLVTFIIGLSPFIFIVVVFILAFFFKPAP